MNTSGFRKARAAHRRATHRLEMWLLWVRSDNHANGSQIGPGGSPASPGTPRADQEPHKLPKSAQRTTAKAPMEAKG